ncbi:MAG TPA: aminoacyl-tRNA hydrolase, partial [Steroidobacteraceae bacterium]|nr:aminoacyl-tRNA hydrolase [Steroidobacteraceae bacterium]
RITDHESLSTMSGTPLKAIVGLGNPGPEHLRTRHNAGFWLVDALAEKFKGTFRAHAKYHGAVCRVEIAEQEITLLKPQTFMNHSGLSIRALCDYLKMAPNQLLIAYDELDLSIGTVRFKYAGGAGGHNGMRSVLTHIGQDCWRLRIGIGHPGNKAEVIDYVLRRAPPEEEKQITDSIVRAIDAIVVFLEQGAEKAMNCLHSKQVNSES